MNYLGISWTSQFINGPSLFKLFQACYDVTTGHMTLRFGMFWQEGNRQVWSGYFHNCVESSGITACMLEQLCIGYSGVYRGQYREVKGSFFFSYESYLVLLKYMTCIDIYGSIFGKRDLLAIDHIMSALFSSYVPNMK